MEYRLDPIKFNSLLKQKGYRSTQHFAESAGLHRNTLQRMLKGESPFVHAFETITKHLQTDPLELIQSKLTTSSPVKDIQHIVPIIDYLKKTEANLAIYLIGSRASGKARAYSDWDIGIFCYPEKLPAKKFFRLKNAVEEISESTPHKVDLINLNNAPIWFLQSITEDKLWLTGNEISQHYFEGILHGIKHCQTD